MFRSMPPTRTPEGIAAEEKCIVQTLNTFFFDRKIKQCIPLLHRGGRSEQNALWSRPGLRQAIIAEVRQNINELRAAEPWRHRLNADDSIVTALEKLCVNGILPNDYASFLELARRHGVEGEVKAKEVPTLRGNSCADTGLHDAPQSSTAPPSDLPPEPTPEPTQTRAAAAVADSEAERASQIGSLAAVLNASGGAIAELGMQLSPSAIAALIAGYAATHGSLAAAAELLPPEHRRQLGLPPPLPPPPPERRATAVQTEPAPPAETVAPPCAASAAAETAQDAIHEIDDADVLLSLCDTIAAKFFGGDKRRSKALRRCVIAMRRIEQHRDRDGIKQRDFVLSMLECYGADDQERLPFCSMLTWFCFYAHRCVDEDNWGGNVSSLHFDQDGGMYLDAWTDVMDFAGHIAINILRGHMFSGMVKSGRTTTGKYSLRDLMDLEERGERLFFGPAVPSVQAINDRVKPEDKVDRGGRSAPVERAMGTFHEHVHCRMEKLTRRVLAPLSDNEVRAVDADAPRFFRPPAEPGDEAQTQSARLALPKKPTSGWKECDAGKWWAREL